MEKQTNSLTIGATIAFIIAALAAIPYLEFPAGYLLIRFITNWAIYTVVVAGIVGLYRAITKRR